MLAYAWQGIEDAIGRVQALAAQRGLDSELETDADTIVTEAQAEPPERPGQRYVRSHRLSGNWRRSDARRSSGSIIVDVTNDTPYGLFVQGEDQAEIHRGRWKWLKVIGDEQRGAIRARVQAWAVKTWRGG